MRGWELLGTRTVTDRTDHDSIAAGGQGTFRSIKITVQRRPVQFRNVKIHFANGDVQAVELRTGRTRLRAVLGMTYAAFGFDYDDVARVAGAGGPLAIDIDLSLGHLRPGTRRLPRLRGSGWGGFGGGAHRWWLLCSDTPGRPGRGRVSARMPPVMLAASSTDAGQATHRIDSRSR